MEKEAPRIFISYSWKDKDVVEEIDKDFSAVGITFIRDVRDLGYKESIRDFMKQVREMDFVLMMISEGYLKSRNCMFEVMSVLKDDDYRHRILPIVLDSARWMFNPRDRIQCIKHWEAEVNALKKELKGISPQNAGGLYEDLNIVEQISRNISEFMTIISDMRSMLYKDAKETKYSEILNLIGYEDSALLNQLMLISKIEDEEEQILQIEEFIENHKGYAKGYFYRGQIAYDKKQYKIARYNFEKAISKDPKYAAAYSSLAKLLSES